MKILLKAVALSNNTTFYSLNGSRACHNRLPGYDLMVPSYASQQSAERGQLRSELAHRKR